VKNREGFLFALVTIILTCPDYPENKFYNKCKNNCLRYYKAEYLSK